MGLTNLILKYYRAFFFSVIYVLYIYVLLFRCELSDFGSLSHDLIRIVASLIEIGFVYLLCVSCSQMDRWSPRFLWGALNIIIAVFGYFIYMAQIFSLYISGNFISVLALRNTDSASFVISSRLLGFTVIAIFWIAFFYYGLAKSSLNANLSRNENPLRRKKIVITLICLFSLNAYLLIMQGRNDRLEAGFWQVPISNFIHNFYVSKIHRNGMEKGVEKLDGLQCFPYPEGGNHGLPFQKSYVYKKPLPFKYASIGKGVAHPNVIVIFSEGTSARLIGAYGGTYPGLTPNIDHLAKSAMRVNNYFNHTAATYRGLVGQLSSGYSFADGAGEGGWETGLNKSMLSGIQRQTLPKIFRSFGYNSYFFSPHREERPFTTMLKSMGFDRVYTYQSIGNELLKGKFQERPNTTALEDQSLFDGLVEFMKSRSSAGNAKPFFAATYNIGTHAFIDIDKTRGVGYGDEGEAFLNKLHNYDEAVGRFLKYFYSSPYVRNTILIFTSDHSAYPEPMFRAVAGKDLKPYFVDLIPMLIFDPTHNLPEEFDADGRNSLDLAPTTLQLAGINEVENSFLGRSLFEERSFPLGIASLADSYYLTMPKGVFAKDEVPDSLKKEFDCETGVISRYYEAEKNNRIFNAE